MKGGEKGVSMLHDNVHNSTGGWDCMRHYWTETSPLDITPSHYTDTLHIPYYLSSIECFLLSFTDEGNS